MPTGSSAPGAARRVPFKGRATPAPPGRRGHEIREAGLDQVHRLAYYWVPFTPAGTLLLAAVIGDTVPWARRLLWASLVMAASAFVAASSWRYLALRRAGRAAGRGTPSLVAHGLLGAAWGSIAVLAFPGPERTDLRAVVILFAAVTSMIGTVATAAAGRRFFLALQVPLVLPIGLVVGLTDERLNRLLGVAIPLYFAITAVLHEGLNRLMVSELVLRHDNVELIESLVAEQDRAEEANAGLREATAPPPGRSSRPSWTSPARWA